MKLKQFTFDYLVVGSGISGLTAAYRLSQYGSVAVLTKGEIKDTATEYAQGGIAVALGNDDTPFHHMQDTMNAGAGLCREESVRVLVEDGPRCVQELITMGTQFDKNGAVYDLTREGAHQKRRILHAGDATGREIEQVLLAQLLNEKKVQFFTNTSIIRLISLDERCYGCVAVTEKAQPTAFFAKATVLATGGCGQIYYRNTNPSVATGDGVAIAFKAGCEVQDMEFMQFHPTTLALGDQKAISIFLISESVRGEGAVLRNLQGERFMPRYHPDAELAPRDIVARSIVEEMAKAGSDHVFLDLSQLKLDPAARFPTIFKRCSEARINISRDFIPVAPAAHYMMGGIRTDLNAKTSLKNLYACGEVASVGIHGANRLASNSLLEGLVFGNRAAEAILSQGDSSLKPFDVDCKNSDHSLTKEQQTKLLSVKQKLRVSMWKNVGIVRNETQLKKHLHFLKTCDWIAALESYQPMVSEIQNMLIVSKLITEFALTRRESRGAHFRSDFNSVDDVNWKHHLVFNKCTLLSQYPHF